MAITEYIFTIDESFQKYQGVAFTLAGILCSKRRCEILDEKINDIRTKYSFYDEIKWSRIGSLSKDKLKIINEILLVFVNDKYWKFKMMKVIKGLDWYKWESNEKRGLKNHYIFSFLDLHIQ